MTATRILIALALAALAAVPAADAQLTAALTLTANSPDHALASGETTNVTGVATFTADATALLNVNGVPVTYAITKAPTWLSATISPTTDIFPIPLTPAADVVVTRPWRLDLLVADNASGDDVSYIEITAIAQPEAPLAGTLSHGASAKIQIPVRLHAATTDPCPDAVAPPAPAASPAAAPVPQPVHVQSATATISPFSWAAIAGFAAVGAGVGLALKRRK